MIADWFDASHTGNPMSALPVVAIVNLTILFLLACAAHAILGRRRALIRSGLWNAVLLASILQPVVMLGLPRLRIACLPSGDVSAVMAETPTLPGFNELPDHHSRDVAGLSGMPVVTSADHSDPVRPDSRPLGEDRGYGMSAPSVLMGIYAAGVVILSLRLIRSLVAVTQLKRTALAVADSSWIGPLAYWRDRLRIARPVSLVWSGRVRIPMLLGWLRPAIVLPVPQDDSEPPLRSHVDAILLHELAHLSRGDDSWNLLQQVVQIVYWPHPLTWLASRLISGVREQACDDLCVHWAGGARHYRAALMAAAAGLVRDPGRSISTAVGLAMARASSSALLRRLSWIERTRGASACRLRWPGRVGIGLAVLGSASLLSTIELSRIHAAQAAREQVLPLDATAPARAYDRPVPASAEFHTATLIVLDDETSKPLADVEVMILNEVNGEFHRFPTGPAGRLRFEYPYIGAKPRANIELRKNDYVPLRLGWGFDEGPDPPADALTIRLRRGTTMGGIVVNAADQPVEGVTVVMTVTGYGPGKRPKNPIGYEIYYEVPSRTGPDGKWRTDSVPPGAEEVNLQLIHPNFVCDGSHTTGARAISENRGPPRSVRPASLDQGGGDPRPSARRERQTDRRGEGRRFNTRLDLPRLRLAHLHGCGRVFPCPSATGRENEPDGPGRGLPARDAGDLRRGGCPAGRIPTDR